MKDPAFLFYAKDFYEGTRMMLPEERACYIDLMIYQHQHGYIPNDIRRVLMYCSGINEATLIATLVGKFIKSENGWHNEKLNEVINSRKDFSNKQSVNGTVGQFWKRVKAALIPLEYEQIKSFYASKNNETIYKEIIEKELKTDVNLKAMLKAMLKHLAIENAIENKDIDNTLFNNKEKSENLNFPLSKNKIFEKELSESQTWIETICMQNKITPEEIPKWFHEFDKKLILEFDNKFSKADYASHFSRWLPGEIAKINKSKPHGNKINPATGNLIHTN